MTIILERRRDWRVRLNAYLTEIKSASIVWGAHDCAVGLAARAIEEMTGFDVAERWRGRYDSASSALRMMREDGFDGLEQLCASILPAFPACMGQIGDIALVPDATGIGALGVVIGDRITVLTETGIGNVDLLTASIIFRVG